MKPILIYSEREELIETVLLAAGIKQQFSDELLDHLHSHTEELMEKYGFSFEKSFAIALRELAPQGLPVLQEKVEEVREPQSFLPVATHWMGILAALSLVTGYWFKLQLWPMANEIIYVGIIAFLAGFLPMRLIEQLPQAKGSNRRALITELLASVGFAGGIINNMLGGQQYVTNALITFAFALFVIQVLPGMFTGHKSSAQVAEE